MKNPPTGTVTFLFTDIEGSTKLAREHPQEWEEARARHHSILREAIESNNGYVFQIIGDAFCAAFHTAKDGLGAAIQAQRALTRMNISSDKENSSFTIHPFDSAQGKPSSIALKVRMGLHTGSAELHGNDYRGYMTLAHVQRVMAVAYGGQVLLSNACAELLHGELYNGVSLRDMKEHRLKSLLNPERLWQVIVPDLQQDFPPLQSLTEIPNNLPVQLTTFIGREKEVGQIKKRLEKNHLVTLTGSGGIGKTRLSIQVASELLEGYPHGAWLVELAPITDPALVAQAICTALDITLQGNTSPLTVLTDFLHSKKLLLVVDNCEHLIDASAQLCETLLRACPHVRIIASSREALGIDGENAYRVPSLSLPDPKSGLHAIEEAEAVKLFTERATAVYPEFELTESNASSVAQICTRLDGIALAIELAASRVKMLKVDQIASRLDDAFRLLTGGSRTALPRQQTLRALIDWSYNLLSDEERIALRRLSVFMGGWTLEAAESVCDNPNMLDLLSHLMDKSLVSVDLEHGEEPRYYLLETIRQYAREKLAENGESETVRNRHMEYFCQFVERIEPRLRGHDQVVLLDGLEMELDNLRAALEWSLDHDVSAGLQLASGLKWFWHLMHHWIEGIDWLEKFLQAEENAHSFPPVSKSDTFRKAKALLVFSHLSGSVGDMERAGRSMAESLALCDKMDGTDYIPLKVESYMYLGIGALYDGDINQAKILAEKSLELSRKIGNKFGIAEVHYNLLTPIAFRSGEYEKARVLSESTLAIRQELGDLDGIVAELDNGGLVALAMGDYERAQKLFRANIEVSRHAHSLGFALGNLGMAYLFAGEMVLAHEYFLQAAKFAREKWNPIVKACSVYWLAMYHFEQKQFRKFIQLNSFLENEKSHLIYLYYLPPIIPETLKRNIIAARAELDQVNLKSAEAQGKAMTLDQALAYALEGIND